MVRGMPRLIPVELAVPHRAQLGEGPRWDGPRSRLLWVDVEGGELHLFDPRTGDDRALALGGRVGAAAPISATEALVALADRLAIVSLDDGALETLVDVPHDDARRLNDGACDARGRFWVGSMALDERPDGGALYRYADGVLEPAIDTVSLSNGIGWSPDGRTMYYVDSPEGRVDAFDFDVDSGSIGNRRPFVVVEDATPDGLAVDDEGGVWVALWGGWCVRRFTPNGALDAVVELPVAKVTACWFGDDDGRTLFVTTASIDLTPDELRDQPHAGCVFAAYPGVSGPAAHPFVR
jgi:sugar lactone lactonase YvrE